MTEPNLTEIRERAEFWSTRDPSTIGHLYDQHAVAFAKEVLMLVDRLAPVEAEREALLSVHDVNKTLLSTMSRADRERRSAEAERDEARANRDRLAHEVAALRRQVADLTRETNTIRTDWAGLVNRAVAAERALAGNALPLEWCKPCFDQGRTPRQHSTGGCAVSAPQPDEIASAQAAPEPDLVYGFYPRYWHDALAPAPERLWNHIREGGANVVDRAGNVIGRVGPARRADGPNDWTADFATASPPTTDAEEARTDD